jgi:hypothetical protein
MKTVSKSRTVGRRIIPQDLPMMKLLLQVAANMAWNAF